MSATIASSLLRKSLLSSIPAATSRILLPTAAASLRPFSVSRSTLNTSPAAATTPTSAQDTFHTTSSTLDDVSSSVLGEPTARTITRWQAGLWERLETEMQTNPKLSDYITRQRTLHLQGTLSMTDLLSFLSRDPSLSLAFNYASLLLNTSFFLEGLVKDPAGAGKQQVPAGYAGLEEQLVAQARGMVGSGWLWIVSYDRKITTIPTYGSGTVLVRNRMQQGRDAATPIFYPPPSSSSTSTSTASSSSTQQQQQQQQQQQPSRVETNDDSDHPYIGTGTDYKPIKPLAVINMFEHAYLARGGNANTEGGLNVWGREQWVRDWFKMVDWAQVKSRANN
ncbi:hypothetical protein QFC24_001365 [Naganishia onofrii]|uniref:Uncharacterized protein n=1 Tax=Naganishia onofrii TaxID=1851511 RepID=A0ACC2XUJ4_9TREE|nr:hypothetical protein QFC24_001365 [Naganishia onofrii]